MRLQQQSLIIINLLEWQMQVLFLFPYILSIQASYVAISSRICYQGSDNRIPKSWYSLTAIILGLTEMTAKAIEILKFMRAIIVSP